jgi:hypothetical protein
MIAAWVGDKDLACEQLATVVHSPAQLRQFETAPALGSAARRSPLRENRRLPRALIAENLTSSESRRMQSPARRTSLK